MIEFEMEMNVCKVFEWTVNEQHLRLYVVVVTLPLFLRQHNQQNYSVMWKQSRLVTSGIFFVTAAAADESSS